MGAILVIDDEKGISDLIREALITFGHSVETACSGKEGIDKFNRARFDVVITDICMPGIDGRGVVEHIRRTGHKPTPVIGMSGTPWLLEQIDFDMVLPKPFTLKSLIESIRTVDSAAP